MASHVERIAQVESDLTELRKGASTTKDIEGLRKEYRKLLVRLQCVSGLRIDR